ncbi:MAG: hypothetical protein V1489_00940 [Candidatus Liptonbacteria bacterium]
MSSGRISTKSVSDRAIARGRGTKKIGVFDSGVGGLLIMKALVKNLPEYDYVYLGDTARVPYGNRSQEIIYQFLEEAVEYLFNKNCSLIIVACNTASAEALRRIQREYLPEYYPGRRVLGVIIPTAEEALPIRRKNKNQNADNNAGNKHKKIGILATEGTVSSEAYVREIKKINSRISVFQEPAPLLVPLIENGGLKWTDPILESYLRPLLKKKIDTLIWAAPIIRS